MTTHPGFLADILTNPDDDAPRLIYADWLEEHGEEARAEFIRCQCACAGYTDCPVRLADLKRGRPVPLRCGLCDYCRNRLRSEKLSHLFAILPPCIPAYGFCLDPSPLDGYLPAGPGFTVAVCRGFVHSLACTAADWLRHADAVRACQPVQRVRLTTMPTWNYADHSSGNLLKLNGSSKTWTREEVGLQVGGDTVACLLSTEFPGIAFELPPRLDYDYLEMVRDDDGPNYPVDGD